MSQIISLINQDKHSPDSNTSRKVGQTGEELAARFLLRKGYRLAAANFTVPIGRNRSGAVVTGEIDLVGYDENVLCFVEVKTRSSDRFAAPLAAVDRRKQRQITRAARMYRKVFRLHNIKFRYDVVSIVLETETRPKIELFKGFWSESKFTGKLRSDKL